MQLIYSKTIKHNKSQLLSMEVSDPARSNPYPTTHMMILQSLKILYFGYFRLQPRALIPETKVVISTYDHCKSLVKKKTVPIVFLIGLHFS